MTNLLNIPLENTFRTTLVQRLTSDATSLTLYLAAVPSATIPGGQKLRITINPRKGFTYQEDVLVTSIDTTAKTMTIASSSDRGLARYNGDSGGRKEHAALSEVIISDPYGLWVEIQNAINSKFDAAGGTITGPVTLTGTGSYLKISNMTTAQRLLLTPSNGMIVYDTDLNNFYKYEGGAWSSFASGSIPNAADHTAGKTDMANQTEMQNNTVTDATSGALNVIGLNMATQSSAGVGDYGKVVQLGSSGLIAMNMLSTNLNSANTFFGISNITGAEAETLTNGSNADSLHTHAAVNDSLIDSNGQRTAESGTSGTTTGSLTVTTTKRAKLIMFDVTLICNEQSGSNGTTIRTWKVFMDLVNQRVCATQLYSTSSGNLTPASIFVSGAANLSHLLIGDSQAMSGSVFSITGSGGAAASITALTSNTTTITLSYSLTAGGGNKSGIAISSIVVLG